MEAGGRSGGHGLHAVHWSRNEDRHQHSSAPLTNRDSVSGPRRGRRWREGYGGAHLQQRAFSAAHMVETAATTASPGVGESSTATQYLVASVRGPGASSTEAIVMSMEDNAASIHSGRWCKSSDIVSGGGVVRMTGNIPRLLTCLCRQRHCSFLPNRFPTKTQKQPGWFNQQPCKRNNQFIASTPIRRYYVITTLHSACMLLIAAHRILAIRGNAKSGSSV